jgi:acetoin utilization deacetylase AcuC-like enzyme
VRVVDPEPHPDEALLAVHDGELLAYLASAWEEWNAAELPQEQVVPYVFARRELGARREATAVWAKPGWFAYDTMTLDPESPLQVSVAAFREAGWLLGTLALPTVVMQEGGYDLQTIGELVRETLVGLEEGRP